MTPATATVGNGRTSSGSTILVVDDSRDDIEFIRRALCSRRPDVRMVVARGGEEALDRLQEVEPALVLLDLKMPGMGGHAVLEAIRARRELAALPVVIFTSSREPNDIGRAYALGANSYVGKPLAHERFVDTVVAVAGYWLDVNLCVPGQDR